MLLNVHFIIPHTQHKIYKTLQIADGTKRCEVFPILTMNPQHLIEMYLS